VRGDADALRVLVSNLIDNALRYTLNGGKVDAVAPEGERVALSVRDTGPGIAPAERAPFRPFLPEPGNRAGATRQRARAAIVRSVADRHGAEITGEGTGGPGLASPRVSPTAN
jgi:signal transduction histidine kinase